MSLIFYAWGEPIYVCLILFSAIVDYAMGLMVGKYRISQPGKAKGFFILSIAVNLAVLSFFKYADFLVSNINHLLGAEIGYLNLPLPIGISFYTFQTMSYIIDVYRGKVAPQRSFISFTMYVTLFPQLIAGPIVRYDTIEKQIQVRTVSFSLFSDGVRIFLIGLGKKVLLANNMGLLWVEIQNQPISELTIAAAWLGIAAFSLQIYFDFNGYSDMAIGLGKMFGFDFPQNFNYPYRSKSIQEFWRRWHITLGSWFREYVYIPLGGNQKGAVRMYVNLFVVWMLTGLWHGASWNYIIWGLYFGILISIEKAFLQRLLNKLHPIFQHAYFTFFILIGWVFFVFEDLQMGREFLRVMLGFDDNRMIDQQFLYFLLSNGVLLLIGLVASIPRPRYINALCKHQTILALIMPFYYLAILVLATAYLVNGSYNPFLYFRF